MATSLPPSDCSEEQQDVASSQESFRLDAIQALRGIAAALVVFFHYGEESVAHARGHSWIMSSGVGLLGSAGVDLFFVISGFIMVYTTRNKYGTTDALAFLRKRALRIYPLYWVWTTVLLLLWAAGIALRSRNYTFAFIVGSYLLFPVFDGRDYHPLLAQGWTLSFEVLFYLVFSCCLLVKPRQPASVLILLAFCGLFLFVKLALFMPHELRYLLSSPLLFEFVYGAIAAEALFQIEKHGRVFNARIPGLLALTGVILFAATVGRTQDGGALRFLWWGFPCFLFVLAAAVYGSGHINCRLVSLGNASYTIYLTHHFFVYAYTIILKQTTLVDSIPVDLCVVAGSIGTIIICAKLYRYTEVPLQRILRAKARSPQDINTRAFSQNA